MSYLYSFFSTSSHRVKDTRSIFCYCTSLFRSYADSRGTDLTKVYETKTQGTESESLRVRRARPADVPRVLRFVREHARDVWPGLVVPSSTSHIILSDYVARALAQGHSMLAEQHENRGGWSQIRGLALGLSVCPWDASILEKWAKCVRCTGSRRLIDFTAQCLRAPALHDKYKVHNILQVVLLVPSNTPKSAEILQVLVKNTINRGKNVGFTVLRFDVTNDILAKYLEELKLNKEWQLANDVLPDIKDSMHSAALNVVPSGRTDGDIDKKENLNKQFEHKGNSISVYTAFTQHEKIK